MAYIKQCDFCGQKISMREMRDGHWVAFDASTETAHKCGRETKPDPNIAALGKKYSINVPFLRPSKFSKDKTPSVDAIEHTINFLKKRGKIYDYVVLLEPTSPFRSHYDIDRSINKILNSSANALVSVSKIDSLNPAFLYEKVKKNFQKLQRQCKNAVKKIIKNF